MQNGFAQQWGKLTYKRGRAAVFGLRGLLTLIALSLVGVVVAPPALSAHDIIGWAQSDSADSGLGLSLGWAWAAFLALDFAAAVCVMICVYCAIVDTRPGVFSLYVWLFAAATAYANHSFGSRPGAPGDAIWFFPAMSLLGPLLLHSVLGFVRDRVKTAAGGKRSRRPVFPLADWLPVVGSPQETYGAWRTGTMLGVESPDQAMWAYQAVTSGVGWWGRWAVRKLVRAERQKAFAACLADETMVLAIPGLVPAGAFVPAAQQDAPAAAPAPRRPRPATTNAAPVQPAAPQAPPARPAVPVRGNVVQMDAAAQSNRAALAKIYRQFGADFGSWEELRAKVSTHRIETQAGIGKRRSNKILPEAERWLPWAEARHEPAGDADARSA